MGGGARSCAEETWGRLPERCHAPQWGESPLHRAAQRGHAAVVEQLLAAGAAVEAKDQVRGAWGDADRAGMEGRTQLIVSSWFSCFVLSQTVMM